MESTRRFTRIECNNNSTVEIGNVVVVEANILNISLDGVLFELKHECLFNKGVKWHLKFKLPNSDIVRQFETEVMHSHGNRVGMKFVDMNADTTEHISRLLEAKADNSQQVGDERTRSRIG